MYKRKILQAFIQIHLLHHASEKQGIYGVQMIEELSRHGYSISPGTLYPLLHKMKNENILTMKSKNVNGRIRKIYTLTPTGKIVLDDLKSFIKELREEVM